MSEIGILAYGSLMRDPGVGIGALTVRRISTITPFAVEYARYSRSRGGAPTVVPHSSGHPVNAEILVLDNSVSLQEAKNLLWRRETRNHALNEGYRESFSANAVVVRQALSFAGVEHVFYTDFNLNGKIASPDAQNLALAAIASVEKASAGRDGISYLRDLLSAGIVTALTPRYVREILALTNSTSLSDAVESIRAREQLSNK